jgi:hypothetical protein
MENSLLKETPNELEATRKERRTDSVSTVLRPAAHRNLVYDYAGRSPD